MNTHFTPPFAIHLSLVNGSHTVVLCDPSLLASSVHSTDDPAHVTCLRCHAARAEDSSLMKEEIRKRLNSK